MSGEQAARVGHVPNLAAFVFGASLAGLSAKQQVFVAAYIGEANRNATEAARIAGYAHPMQQGHRLLINVDIQAAITEHLAQVKRKGIALHQNRVDALVERHNKLNQVIKERAADAWLADVPGGSTGLVVKNLKSVKHIYEADPEDEKGKAYQTTVEQWESSIDTGLLRELREHEKQVAQELGEWTEKSEVSGPDGGPIRIRSIVVPLPVTDPEPTEDDNA